MLFHWFETSQPELFLFCYIPIPTLLTIFYIALQLTYYYITYITYYYYIQITSWGICWFAGSIVAKPAYRTLHIDTWKSALHISYGL